MTVYKNLLDMTYAFIISGLLPRPTNGITYTVQDDVQDIGQDIFR